MSDLKIDMKGLLPGTVKYYEQHLIVCSGHSDWPAKIEEEAGFTGELISAIKVSSLGKLLRITACNRPSEGPGTDVLIFPERIRLIGLRREDLPAVVRYLIGDIEANLRKAPFEKPIFLICGHANRDPRCGQCGPGLHSSLQFQIDQTVLGSKAEVWLSSHLGGHRFAGVVVCYPSGNWYGRVAEEDIPSLIEAEIQGGEPGSPLWRGQMGMTVKEQLALGAHLNSRKLEP